MNQLTCPNCNEPFAEIVGDAGNCSTCGWLVYYADRDEWRTGEKPAPSEPEIPSSPKQPTDAEAVQSDGVPAEVATDLPTAEQQAPQTRKIDLMFFEVHY